jgi:multiple sugar transport system permease protein
MRATPRTRLERVVLAIAIALLLAWSIAPAAWQALTAVKPDAQLTRVPLVYLPHPPVWTHVSALLRRKPFGAYLWNSARIGALATLLCLACALPAASVIARQRGRARIGPMLVLLGASLFPPILLLFPLYEGVRALGWINLDAALVVPYAALNLPLATWVLEAGVRVIPAELDAAAELDGLGALGRIRHLHVPLAAPSIATAAILVFMSCWNEFLLALTFMTRDAAKTVTAGIASVSGASFYEIPWGQLAAAIVLATLPLVALVLACEGRIRSGLTRGAVSE